MNRKEAIEIIRKEYLCVDHDCDIERNCGKCDLVMPSKEPILEAYKMAMNALAELKTGCWIDIDSKSFEFHRVYKCSECGNTEIEYPEEIHRRFRYCPNCGAKMEDKT